MNKIMFRIAFLVAVMCGPNAFARFERVKITGFDKSAQDVWVHQKNKKWVITASVLKDAWFELTSAGAADYVKKLEETRGTVNFFAGITDWSVKTHSFAQEKDRGILVLQGEFKHAKNTMYFREQQIFIKPDIYQIKISSPEFRDLSDEKTAPIFATFKKELP